MPNFRFEPDHKGIEELMLSPEMQAVLEAKAREVLGRLPSGYGMTPGTTENTSKIRPRAKVTVGTRSSKAASDNLKNNTLVKALGG